MRIDGGGARSPETTRRLDAVIDPGAASTMDDDAAPVEAMQAGSTFLLLDERNIIASHNVQLKLGSVTKHPSNPLLREEKP